MTRMLTSLLTDPRVLGSAKVNNFLLPWDVEEILTPYTRELLVAHRLNLEGIVDYALHLLPLVEEVGDPDDLALVLSKLERDYPEFIDGEDWTALETVGDDILRIIRLVDRYFPSRLAGFGMARQQMYTRRIDRRALCLVTSRA